MNTHFKNISIVLKVLLVAGVFTFAVSGIYGKMLSSQVKLDTHLSTLSDNHIYEQIVLAGGCFWSTESVFDHVEGVISAVSGYADSDTQYSGMSGPAYNDVGSGKVKARESVLVTYDPKKISTEKILEIYFKSINPTDAGGQFFDRGYQYTSAIYYKNIEQEEKAKNIITRIDTSKKFSTPVAVAVLPYTTFYPAEEYHQQYKDKNPVSYGLYREGSGRDRYIRTTWLITSPHVEEIFSSKTTNTITTTTPMQNTTTTQVWNNFTKAQKEEKLKTLTPLQVTVTQKEGTERNFANEYYNNKEKGIYVDIVSGEPLFLSTDKYDSGTGWPSFVKPIDDTHITLHKDDGFLTSRIEVKSKVAESHLGHVFDDGPADRGGKRYCMNSASLRFIPIGDMEKEGYGEFISKLK